MVLSSDASPFECPVTPPDSTKAIMHMPIPFPAGPDRANAESPAVKNVIIAYENLSAALWAAEILPRLLRQILDGPKLRVTSWSFSNLENQEHREKATAAAGEADLIVIASSHGSRPLPEAVESWLEKCRFERRNANAAVAALSGRAHLPDSADAPRRQTVQRLAKETGCEFFAPCVTEAELSVA